MTQTDYFYSQICHIQCNTENGMGFLVSPTQIVTADHVLTDAVRYKSLVQISFEIGEEPWEYTIENPNIFTIPPCSFLTLPSPRFFRPLLLRASAFERDIHASVYAIRPEMHSPRDAFPLKYVAQSKWNSKYRCKASITLKPDDTGLSTYEGYSGAPIIVGNCIDGLLVSEFLENGNAVRVFGIAGIAFQDILTEAKIPFFLHKENTASPCLLNPEHYNRYLNNCKMESDWIPLEEQRFLEDRQLFWDLNIFIHHNWPNSLLAGLKLKTDEHKLFNGFLEKVDVYSPISEIAAFLYSKIDAALRNRKRPSEALLSLKRRLEEPFFNNCMFISGYYGSGKTALAIAAARHAWTLSKEIFKPIFLIVQPSGSHIIQESLLQAFQELLGTKHILSEYLDALANHTLVIVLDDVHEYFQAGATMQTIRDLIETYSRPYVKWMVMTQTGYGREPSDMYSSYFTKYAYKWSSALYDTLVGQWLQLDDWYRKQDLPQQILRRKQPFLSTNWLWKESASSTNYYNPLLANVLLVHAQRNNNWSILSYNNFLFPAFCDTYYHLLSQNDMTVITDAEAIAEHLLSVCSLCFRLEASGLKLPQVNRLVNHGLLMDTNRTPTFYKGIPDIVWYYLICSLMDAANMLKDTNAKDILQTAHWKNNPEDFSNILSIWILFKKRSEEETRNIWKVLFDCGFGRAALDSGFKCDAALRNDLIRMVLKHEAKCRDNFTLFMRLCSLGKIEIDLFYEVIRVCISQCTNVLMENHEIFAYMLLQNYQYLGWEDVLNTLSLLAPIVKTGINEESLCRLGRNIGRSVAQKASAVNQLEKAILHAYAACDGDESNLPYFRQEDAYHTFPIELFDGFCSDFCNTVIKKYRKNGYCQFEAAGWYSYAKKPTPNQQRRNKALTFALAFQYRYAKQVDKDYVTWYEQELVKPLSQDGIEQKTFALYLIMHSGLKENHYRIEKGSFLWDIAKILQKDKTLRNVRERPAIRAFYRTNFTNDNPSTMPRALHGKPQRRTRKKEENK